MRWTQSISFSEGAYRFKARADDGVRVWVDDRQIIDAWLPNVEQTFVGYVWLAQGNHTVRVEYLELGGSSSVQVWREEITSFTAWRGEYYANPDLAGNPLFVRDDDGISADWGEGSPGYGMPADGFSIRWTRRLLLDAGRHNFWAYADDGVRVYVNGRLVIDAWQDSSAERRDGTIDLDAGEHRIVVEYYEKQGQAVDPVRDGKERPGNGDADGDSHHGASHGHGDGNANAHARAGHADRHSHGANRDADPDERRKCSAEEPMIHTYRPESYHNNFGPYDPVLSVHDGDTISTTTVDSRGRDASMATLASGPNPLTGPFFVHGAEPGDTLAVDILSIRPDRTYGYASNALAAHVVEPSAVMDLPARQLPSGMSTMKPGRHD